MEDESWKAYFTETPPPAPSLRKIIADLWPRILVNPIFVCLVCTKESSSQQAMAVHCRQHVRAGMAKGTVRHIKYNPDHTMCELLCTNPQPGPQDPRSANRVKKVPLPSYKTVPAYTGGAFMSNLAGMLPKNPNGVGPLLSPIGMRPNVDLTLRLGPTRSTPDDSKGLAFSSPGSSSTANNIYPGDDPKGKKVIPGPSN